MSDHAARGRPSPVPPLPEAAFASNPPTLHQINVSPGGVPKLPVPQARIELDGIVGDHQADRRYHGAPDQALCLYSLEVLQALAGEGHPIEPGSSGDNLTLCGLFWPGLRAGDRLRVGAVLVELTDYAVPCSKNGRYFRDAKFSRMSEKLHPGWSRWYARVLSTGVIARGDAVEAI